MLQVCVDASLVLMLLLPEEHSERAEALWARWDSQRMTRLAPPLLYVEVPSVLREGVFFGGLSAQEGEEAFQTFCDLVIAVSTRPDLHLIAWDLAKRHNRPRAYDAYYLAAAQAEGCELWSGDKKLVNAVRLPWVKWVGEFQG